MITAADLRDLTYLGTLDVLGVQLTDVGARCLGRDPEEVEIEINRPFFWSARAAALVSIVGIADPVFEPAPGPVTGDAARTSRRWKGGRDVEQVAHLEVPAIRGRWCALGRATLIEYSSSKWNDRDQPVAYRHRVEGRVTVYRLSDGTRAVWACQGGKLRITGGRSGGRVWGGIADG